METSLLSTSVNLHRCALCKIDLKGKIVYVDDKIETLLGYSKEELFGKSFSDFLDKSSKALIDQLLSQRNNYEIFYDAVDLTIMNRDKKAINTRAVLSLNFINGNPVNFQLIIDPLKLFPQQSAHFDSSDVFKLLVEELAELETPVDIKQFLQIFIKFTDASQACLYLITKDKLEPRSCAGNDNSAEFVFKSIASPTALHKHVAHSGENYSFVDQLAVQKVIERYGHAPNEFVARIELDDDRAYLLRLIFADNFDSQKAKVSIKNAHIALRLMKNIMTHQILDGNEGQDETYDIKFTIGFLDALGIPAFLCDKNGDIIGYNPSMLHIFDKEQLNGSYIDVVKSVSAFNFPNVEKTIIDYINSSYQEGLEPDFKIKIKLSDNYYAHLTILKISDTDNDLSSCFVFVPEVIVDGDNYNNKELSILLRSVFVYLKKKIKIISHKINSEYSHPKSGKKNSKLFEPENSFLGITDILNQMLYTVKLINQSEESKQVDLNILIKDLLQKQIVSFPDMVINCRHKNLPTVKTFKNVLKTILQNLLTNAIKFNDKPTKEITINAIVKNKLCQITVSDNASQAEKDDGKYLFNFLTITPKGNNSVIEEQRVNLAITKSLVNFMKGEITVSSRKDEGYSVTVGFPVE